jgi:hypothetical protein
MKKLAYVCLNDNPDLASVNLKFAKIKVLHLGYCNQIASLPFEQLETLEELNLACNPKLENLTLKNLPDLKTVNVNSCSLEKALFENLPVEKVNLSYNPKLSKVSFLKCSKIKEIVDSQCENLLYIDFQESGSPVIAGKAIWKKKDHRE